MTRRAPSALPSPRSTPRFAVAAVLAGCAALGAATAHAQVRDGGAAAGRPARAPDASAGDAGRASADDARRAQVVARVGSATITVGEFEDMLNEAPAPVRQAYVDPARRREFLENLVATTLLAEEARRRGIDRGRDVSASIRRILSQALQQHAVIAAITPDTVTDAEVRAYYDAHIGDYNQPEFRRATVIFLNDRAAATEVAQLARGARGDMRRIQTLADERSVDPASREHHGDLFYFRRTGGGNGGETAVDPAVSGAAFALAREMEVGGPVQTASGKWAVVVLTGIRPALSRTISDPGVVNSIRGYIVRERRARRERELLDELRARANPETHPERLDLIQIPATDLGNIPPFAPANPAGAPRRPDTQSGASPVPPGGLGAAPPAGAEGPRTPAPDASRVVAPPASQPR